MAQMNKAAVRKAGGPAKNPMPKTTGTKAKAASAAMPKPDRMWEIKSAMDTLMRADELKRDPAMMRDVKKLAAEQAKKLQKIC